MKNRIKHIAAVLGFCLALTACGTAGGSVNAEPVAMLIQASTAAERFAGLVVSENAVEINRESGKSIKELYVEEGQDVTEGQKLFSYDSEELQLQLDKQELDMERLDTQISNTQASIADVEKELRYASGDTKTQLNIQLRTLETELTQATYDKASLQAEIDYTKSLLENVDVLSPIDGTVRKIDENGSGAYIVIQQAGAYLVKGMLNEMNMGAGIMEGASVTIVSRLDQNQIWNGVVTKVDYENAEQSGSDSMYYGNVSEMTGSSSYPFYVELETTEGLLLGQHVFIQLGQTVDPNLVWVPESYLMNLGFDEATFESTAEVWAVGSNDTLEKRTVVLGMYDVNIGCYEILSGLSTTDYIADPSDPNCKEGAAVIRRSQEDFIRPEQPQTGTGDAGADVADDDMSESMPEFAVDMVITTGNGEE